MNNKTKTVLVTGAYFPPDTGGSARYAFESSMRLVGDYDWKIIVATSNSNSQKDIKENVDGMTVHRFAFSKKISNTPLDISWIWKIRKLIRETKPDVIVIHTPAIGIGDIASFWAGKIPTVVAYHTCGSMAKNDSSLLDLSIKFYERFLLSPMFRRAKCIVCSSDFLRFNFLNKYIDKSVTLASAVDHEIFTPDETKKPSSPTVLFVANLASAEQYKGLSVLLEAIQILKKQLPEIKLNVVGNGDMLDFYKSYVSKNDLEENVKFLGKLGGKELTEAYQRAHIFALPTSYDSLPNVVLEAMSTGLPIVTSTVGDLPATVDGDKKAGFVISPITAQGFAEKVQELFEKPELYKEFSKNSREVILERMSWQKRAKGFNEVITKIAFSD
jgi:glycosyltransferase involved in cell wall biosynthesis